MKWSKEKHSFLVELKLSDKYTWKQIAEEMTAKFPFKYTDEQCRNRWRTNRHKLTDEIDPKEKHGYKFKEYEDGSFEVQELIEITKEKAKDHNYLLKAHGYDPKYWKVIRHDLSRWQHHNKQDGTKTLHSSKLRVAPKGNELSLQDIEELLRDIKPIKINIPKYKVKEKRLLEIPLFDQHFGISDYKYYKPTQTKIHHLIISKVWEEILFTIGSDMLHHNDHQNRTASGREIQHLDITQAWEDARKFYEPLIEKALKQCNQVKIIYKKGNHDESLSWAFVQMLKAKYPQVEFDDEFEERKVHTFGKVFIGFTHGDKGRKKLHNIFPVEFPKEWANANVREIHTGHFHREDGIDEFGTMVRTLATRNKTDKWHKDNAYVGAHKRFMVFEYSESELESIHYV